MGKENYKQGILIIFPRFLDQTESSARMALALKNKKIIGKKMGIKIYKGKISDDVKCIIYLENGKITTMHPSFK